MLYTYLYIIMLILILITIAVMIMMITKCTKIGHSSLNKQSVKSKYSKNF